ncbi:MAG: alpha/beta hydrolase [Bacteroidales bacterium]|nr:alpha/beta hydrolase [Bacteroidales bacterium]
MKKILTTIGMMCFCVMLNAQTQDTLTIHLWPNGAPNPNGLSGPEIDEGRGRISNISDPTITVYRPRNPNGMAIMAIPGGAFVRLAMNHEGHDMSAWLNTMGITLVVLKHRMPNGHPDVPLSDAEQAMRIIRENAQEWGLDAKKIGVMGASAGGHLAATLSTIYSEPLTRPDFQIILYPAINMMNGSRAYFGENPSEELKRKYSPNFNVTEHTPPAFITVASDDRLLPNSILYYQALHEKRVSVGMFIYPSGGHGWGFMDSFPFKREWTGELETWLRTL